MYNFVEEVSRMMYSERKAAEAVSEIFNQAEIEDFENLDGPEPNEVIADLEFDEDEAHGGGGFWDDGNVGGGDGGSGGGD